MRGKDKGFSLVELIVVIAIMAVAVSVSGYALSTISLANAKNCATEIKSKLDLVRLESTTNLDQAAQVLWLYEKDDSVYLQVGSGTAKEIGNSSVTVKCDGSALTEDGVKFQYDKGSGAFVTFGCGKIEVSGAGREYTLTLYQKTGKVKME